MNLLHACLLLLTALIAFGTQAASIVSVTPPANGTYSIGMPINFTVNFDAPVNVTGTPRIGMNVGGHLRYATFASGSGSSSLTFTYVVASGYASSTGVGIASPVGLNGGTINDLGGSPATLTFRNAFYPGIIVDAPAPSIVSVTGPPSPPSVYLAGQTVDFTVTFSEPMIASKNTSRLRLLVGSSFHSATLVSGSGTSTFTYRYLVGIDYYDPDGITMIAPLELNGSTIKNADGFNLNLAFTPPSLASIIIDGRVPTVTANTRPANGFYTVGQNLDFTLTYSRNVYVTGNPRVAIHMGVPPGEVSLFADYTGGSGTNQLSFRYTVQASDYDPDGAYLNQWLNMDQGTIVDDVGNSVTFAYWGMKMPNMGYSTVLLDGSPTPTVSGVTAPAAQEYTTGQNLNFQVTFSRPVIVSLVPRIALNVGGVTKYADYVSGGGTDTLLFRYTVQAGDADPDGIAISSPIQLNGGTIQNVAMTHNASLSFTAPDTSGVLVDGYDPIISSVTPPANKTYKLGENLDFNVNFTTNVLVSGTPRLDLVVGATPLKATYVSGSGTSTLLFRYAVASGHLDADGITLQSPIDLNGGSITDPLGDQANVTFLLPSTGNVRVDGVVPTLSTVTGPSAGTYGLNDALDFTVNFSENVTVTGSPRIPLVIGSTTRYATYQSGSGTSSVVFRYTVSTGDNDADGIVSLSPLQLNSGTIADTAGNDLIGLSFTAPNTTGVLVDSSTGISSLTLPANGTYKTGNVLNFLVNYPRKVNVTGTPRIAITAGGQTVYANYFSGTNSTTLTFRYTVASGVYDTDGIQIASPIQLNGGSITGVNGSAVDFPIPDTSGILMDGINVAVSGVTGPSAGSYRGGQHLNFIVNYNYPAVVVGTPRIQLTIGSTTRYATYLSGSGTTAHLFRYVINSGDLDSDGIATAGTAIDLNGGTIKDPFGDNATVTFTAGTFPTVTVDAVIPSISSVTGPSNATYGQGQNLDFTVQTSEAVTVAGTPRLTLTVGSTTKYATYVSGSGSNTLTFRYTVAFGDIDADGIAMLSTVDLNGGTITDAGGNNLSPLSFSAPNLSLVRVNGNTSIDLVTAPSNGTYGAGAQLDFIVDYSAPVTVSGTPRLPINVGVATAYADYLSGSGTASLTFRYTVQIGDLDLNGIALTGTVDSNGGSILDGGSNPAAATFTPPNTSGIIVDAADTTIASITPPANGSYGLNQNLDFTVLYTAAATVTGTPRIQLTVGASTVYANYLSGSGTNTHVFRYTIGAGASDSDGIESVGPSILLNGGTIKDPNGDDVILSFTGANYPSVLVDTVPPTISLMSVSANKTYAEGENIDFTATYSEAVSISGSPRLTLTVGAVTAYANYVSGSGTSSIVFRYTVPLGSLDTDGITVATTVGLNGGTITDLGANAQTNFGFTAPNTSGVLVDSISPTIASITPPASQTYSTGANVNFSVTFSEPVAVTGSPSLTLDVGGTPRAATYFSGSGTATLVFRYTVVSGDNDPNGVERISPLILNGGTIKDLQGNTATLNFTNLVHTGVVVDALAPSIASVTLPEDNTYRNLGLRPSISFTVSFNEVVTVTGTPRIHLTVGSTTTYANYASGSGTTDLVFTYAVGANDFDLDGIEIANSGDIDLNGGAIRDAVNLNAGLALNAGSTSGVLVVYSNMASWYDLSDETKLVFSGFNVSGLVDKIGTYNLTHSGSGAVYNTTGFNGGSQAYATCTSATSFDGANQNTPMAIVAVYRAPTNTTNQYLFYATQNSRPMVQFSSTANGGTVTFGVNGMKFSGGAWSAAAATATNVWASGQVAARAFAWSSDQKKPNSLCQMNGEIAEAFFFSSQPTATQLTQIQSYIFARYGLNFP